MKITILKGEEEIEIGGVLKEVAAGLTGVATRKATTTKVELGDYCCCPLELAMLAFGEGEIQIGYCKNKQ